MQSRASRVARGWMAGAFATAIAGLSHGLADGGSPSALALGAAFVFAGLLGTFAIGRRPSLPRLAVVVAGSQVAFHLVFSALTPGTATGGSHHGGAAILDAGVAHHGTDPWMWAAHGVALVATLLFLRKAELAVFELLREAVLEVVATVIRRPALGERPTILRTSSGAAPRHPFLVFLMFVVSHRGPPSAAAAH